MILPDVNVLLYAYDPDSPWHETAKAWWEEALDGEEAVGLCWPTLISFLRIATNGRVYEHPMRVAEAIGHVKSWLRCPMVQVVHPGERHAEILFRFLEGAGAAGNLTPDAHLAALAVELRAKVASSDLDFGRFPGVRWFNPVK
jgi:hypothetical protein